MSIETINQNWNLIVAIVLVCVAVAVLTVVGFVSLIQGAASEKPQKYNDYDVSKAANYYRENQGTPKGNMISANQVPASELFSGIDCNVKPTDTIYYPNGKVKRYGE
jgi:hypothetical protein